MSDQGLKATTRIPSRARILVTGASGGAGSQIVRALLQAGYRVRATDRISLEEAGFGDFLENLETYLQSNTLEWVQWDLSWPSSYEDLLEDCHAVVHAAAQVSLSETYDEMKLINVDVVDRLFHTCQKHNIEHLIHLSCGALYEARRGSHDETSALSASNSYESSKLDGERVFLRYRDMKAAGTDEHSRQPGHWTVLRLGLLYGPRTRTMSAGMVTLPPIFRGFMKYLPGFTGGPRSNWCHVEDAAQAVLHVLGRAQTYGQVYNVADNVPLSFGEVMTSITEAYGLEVGPLIPIPNSTWRGLVGPFVNRDVVFDGLRILLRQLWQNLRHEYELTDHLRPRVERKAFFYVDEDAVLDTTRLRALGWSPKWPDFRMGIRDAVRWYQDHKWVPRYDTQALIESRQARDSRHMRLNDELQGCWRTSEGFDGGDAHLHVHLDFFRGSAQPGRREGVRANIDGILTLEGLVEEVPIEGLMALQPTHRDCIHYEFGFVDANGAPYRFFGRAPFSWIRIGQSLSVLPGRLFDRDGQPIADIEFRYTFGRRWPHLIKTMRLHTA